MELLLIQDVMHVGRKGDVVKVRDGFGRNYLIPRHYALPATRANRVFIEEQRTRVEARRVKERAAAEEVVKSLERIKVVITAKIGAGDKLFGSITAEQIADNISRKKGHKVDKKQVQLEEPIKTLGTHIVEVEVYPQVKAKVTVEVVGEPQPA